MQFPLHRNFVLVCYFFFFSCAANADSVVVDDSELQGIKGGVSIESVDPYPTNSTTTVTNDNPPFEIEITSQMSEEQTTVISYANNSDGPTKAGSHTIHTTFNTSR